VNRHATTNNATKAGIYLRAAEIMASGESVAVGSCCWAIALAKDPEVMMLPHYDEDSRALKMIYAPRGRAGYWLRNIGDSEAERHNGRILALCFMAAMVEAGDA
jgi:hypothetical protein